jgi:uncharacterized membrane protein YdjX (TVP38/TMEM64 family)
MARWAQHTPAPALPQASRVVRLLTVLRGHGQARAMVSSTPVPKKKLPLAQLAIASVVLLAIAAAVLYFIGWRTAWEEGKHWYSATMAAIASAGPFIFFSAMALLPAVGAPTLAFALIAGPAFGARMGMPLVITCGIVALTINLTLTYWLARTWLRPLVTRLFARFGYPLPQVSGSDATDLIVLLRVTPGIPFSVQNYTLGLANAPFVRYFAISCGIQWVLNAGFMLFGDALSQGRGKMVLTAVLLLATATVATQLARKHMAKKKAATR